MYRYLLFVHIAGVILWVGAGALFQLLAERVSKKDDATRIREFLRTGGLVPPAYFGILTAVVLGSGVWLVIDTPYAWADPFVIAGLIGIAASGAIGGGIIGKTTDAMKEVVEAPVADEATMRAGLDKLRTFGKLDLLIMTVVVFMMTVKLGT